MVIGLIGAQNSHAAHFLKAINGEKLFDGVSVGFIYGGDDPATAARLTAEYGLKECPDEKTVIKNSDAVAITYRRGSLHHNAAMKVLCARKPVFIDKPFTSDEREAQEIVEYASRNGLLICGGSNTKGLRGVADVSEKIKPGDTVVISYCANPEDEYDGYWFYGIHSVEVCLELLGLNYNAVSAVCNGGTVVSTISYPDNTCVLITAPEVHSLDITVFDKNVGTHYPIELDYQSIGPCDLIDMVRSGKPPREYDFYAASVRLLNEIICQAGLSWS